MKTSTSEALATVHLSDVLNRAAKDFGKYLQCRAIRRDVLAGEYLTAVDSGWSEAQSLADSLDIELGEKTKELTERLFRLTSEL